MSPNRKYYALQFLMVALWLLGGIVLFATGLEKYIFIWLAVCAVIGFSSWTVGCPQCGRSVYLSRLSNFFIGRGPMAQCSRCGYDLKYGRTTKPEK